MFDVIVNNGKGERLQNFHCPVSECTIGKARDNFIQLRGWKVANHHAEISRTSEGLFIEDKTGKSNIEVNGNDVNHHGPIRSSDVIIIAGYHIKAGMSGDAGDGDDIDEDDDDAFDEMKTVFGVQHHDVLANSEEISKTLMNLQ
ncbi:MAG: pSer/pThr/pTyr-binding forkhead associated (FHA) protein, partial [Gammaproteobacteria bacterium]